MVFPPVASLEGKRIILPTRIQSRVLRFEQIHCKAARPRVDSHVGMVPKRLDVGDYRTAGHVCHVVDDDEDV